MPGSRSELASGGPSVTNSMFWVKFLFNSAIFGYRLVAVVTRGVTVWGHGGGETMGDLLE